MKDQLNLSLYHDQKYLEEENGNMEAFQISPEIESFARLSFGQFFAENSLTRLGSFSFIKISVEMFPFSI